MNIGRNDAFLYVQWLTSLMIVNYCLPKWYKFKVEQSKLLRIRLETLVIFLYLVFFSLYDIKQRKYRQNKLTERQKLPNVQEWYLYLPVSTISKGSIKYQNAKPPKNNDTNRE